MKTYMFNDEKVIIGNDIISDRVRREARLLSESKSKHISYAIHFARNQNSYLSEKLSTQSNGFEQERKIMRREMSQERKKLRKKIKEYTEKLRQTHLREQTFTQPYFPEKKQKTHLKRRVIKPIEIVKQEEVQDRKDVSVDFATIHEKKRKKEIKKEETDEKGNDILIKSEDILDSTTLNEVDQHSIDSSEFNPSTYRSNIFSNSAGIVGSMRWVPVSPTQENDSGIDNETKEEENESQNETEEDKGVDGDEESTIDESENDLDENFEKLQPRMRIKIRRNSHDESTDAECFRPKNEFLYVDAKDPQDDKMWTDFERILHGFENFLDKVPTAVVRKNRPSSSTRIEEDEEFKHNMRHTLKPLFYRFTDQTVEYFRI